MKHFIYTIVMLLLASTFVNAEYAYSGGTGTASDPYKINTLTDLRDLSKNGRHWHKHFIQIADIDASATIGWNNGEGFYSIGTAERKFTGTYDGGGKVIKNLYIHRKGSNDLGLFGNTIDCTIKNLGVTNVDIYVMGAGALVGWLERGKITNCYSTGELRGDYAGGLVAISYNSTISQSYSECNITGANSGGNFVGELYDNSILQNCYSTGNTNRIADCTSENFGAFVGKYNNSTIENCYSTGNVYYGKAADPVNKGFIGEISGTNTYYNNFFDKELSNQNTDKFGIATPKTIAEMKDVATFSATATVGLTTAWDFEANPNDDGRYNNYWDIDLTGAINNGYPFLSWQNGNNTALYIEHNNALNFDGINDYVEVDQAVIPNSGNFTISVWAKANPVQGGFREVLSQLGGFYFGKHENGSIRVCGWNITNPSFPLDDIWHFYTIVKSSSNTYFYIDGVLKATKGSAIANPTGTVFRIGCQYETYGEYFKGEIDEVRIWNTARAATQIRENMCHSLVGTESGLVAYYEFKNSGGTTLKDLISNNKNGTLMNMSNNDWVHSELFTTWTGNESKAWDVAGNWSNGIPTATANVGIVSTTNTPIITGTPTFNNCVVSNGAEITLSSGFTVNGNLILENNLDLNGQTITLGSTATLIEGSGNLSGATGQIKTTRILNKIDEDVAGLGAKIISSANMGSTTIKRGHTVQTSGNKNSIRRYFDIIPTNNTELNATLLFSYQTDELSGFDDGVLELSSSPDSGSSWVFRGGIVDLENNTIALDGIDNFSRFTIFASSFIDDIIPPHTVSLSSFTAIVIDNNISLNWTTFTEINNYGFEVERALLYEDGTIGTWDILTFVDGFGDSNSPQDYEFIDSISFMENQSIDSLFYRLNQIDTDEDGKCFDLIVKIDAKNIMDIDEETLPTEFLLEQNYPNPFNPTTMITYGLVKTSNVVLKVHNFLGQEVATLVNKRQESGKFNITFNASNLPSGVYFYSIRTDNNTSVKKMLLLR